MKTYGGVKVYLHAFLTSALVGGEWSGILLGRFTPGEMVAGTHWIGGCVGTRARLDVVDERKISSPEFNPDSSAFQPVASCYTD
jgi:hypothetical protein